LQRTFWGGLNSLRCCVATLEVSHSQSLSGKMGGETEKGGGHDQNWTEKNQPSTLITF